MFGENLKKYVKENKIFIIVQILYFIMMYICLYWVRGGYEERVAKEELYSKIPQIKVYNYPKVSLDKKLKPVTSFAKYMTASHTFAFRPEVSCESVKQYYTEELLKLGWVESCSYVPEYDDIFDSYYADRFTFDKGDYRLALIIRPPLKEDMERRQAGKESKSVRNYRIDFGKKKLIHKTEFYYN